MLAGAHRLRRRLPLIVAITTALMAAACSGTDSAPEAAPVTSAASAGTTTTTTSDEAPDWSSPGWIEAENQREGSRGWQPSADAEVWERIRGFADVTSTNTGEPFTLHVSTPDSTYRVEAYRMGYYNRAGGRLIWTSDDLEGTLQSAPTMEPVIYRADAPWDPSVTITPDEAWPPGMYLLKLVSSSGGESLVPIVIRDDSSDAPILIQSSVTTWQAYNGWGDANHYTGGADFDPDQRARVVSFDRPYHGNGSGEFFGREFELIWLAEQLGLDVTYWTDIDLHAGSHALDQHSVLVTLGHDEYWSRAMRDRATDARDDGLNLVFFGANAVFRQIRLDPSPVGEHRWQANYRVAAEDPMTGVDDSLVSVNWRESPVNEPESSLVGPLYECNPVDADMVITAPAAWVFNDTGLTEGSVFPGLVGNEYDRLTPGVPTPDPIEVLAHSPVRCKGVASHADMTYYTAPSGAGVIATGTLWWIGRHLMALCDEGTFVEYPGEPGVEPEAHPQASPDWPCQVQQVTENILRGFSNGPAANALPVTDPVN